MSALSAIRFNPKIKEFYNRLKENGIIIPSTPTYHESR